MMRARPGEVPHAIRTFLCLCLAAAAMFAGPIGCRYSTSSLLRDDIRTVYIPVFDNSTWRRGLEVDLTRAVVEEIKLHTPLTLAPRDEADSILEGEIIQVEQDVVIKAVDREEAPEEEEPEPGAPRRAVVKVPSREAPETIRTREDDVLLQRVPVKVRFRWVDNLTGQDIVPPTVVSHPEAFALARAEPLAEWISRELAQRIVEKMEKDW